MCRLNKVSRANKVNRRTSSGLTIISNDRKTATTRVVAEDRTNARVQVKAQDRTKDRAWVKVPDRKAEAKAEDRVKVREQVRDRDKVKVRDRVKDRDKDRTNAAAINEAPIVRAAAISAAVRTVQAAAAVQAVLDNSSSRIAALSNAVRLLQNRRLPMIIRIQAAIASRRNRTVRIKVKTNVLKINQTASNPDHPTIKAIVTIKAGMRSQRKRKKSTIRRKKSLYAVR